MIGHGPTSRDEKKIPPQTATSHNAESSNFEQKKLDAILDIQQSTPVEKVQLSIEETLEKELTSLSINSVQSSPVTDETTLDTDRAGELDNFSQLHFSEDFEPHALGFELREEELQEAFEFFAEGLDSLDHVEEPAESENCVDSLQVAVDPTYNADAENFSDILERDLNPDLISALETLSDELFSGQRSKLKTRDLLTDPTSLIPACLPCPDQAPVNTDSVEEFDIPNNTDTEHFLDSLGSDLNPDLISALELLSGELFSGQRSKLKTREPFAGPTTLIPACLPCPDQPTVDTTSNPVPQFSSIKITDSDADAESYNRDDLIEKEETLSSSYIEDPESLIPTFLPCLDQVSIDTNSHPLPQVSSVEITEFDSNADSSNFDKLKEEESSRSSLFTEDPNSAVPICLPHPDQDHSNTNSTLISQRPSIEEPELNIDFEAGDLDGLTLEELEILIEYSKNQMMDPSQNQEEELGNEHGYEDIPIISERAKAHEEAAVVINSFEKKKNERQCLGHKEVVFGLSLSDCGKFLATAGQDSTICVWNVETNRLLSTLKGHDIKHECLRVTWASSNWGFSPSSEINTMTIASAGADGQVKLWKSSDAGKVWNCVSTLDHCSLPEGISDDGEGKSEEEGKEKEKEVPQIYSLQFIDTWDGLPSYLTRTEEERKHRLSCLMTSSDDQIHIWQQCTDDEKSTLQKDEDIPEEAGNIVKLMDIKFTHLEFGYGGTFVHLNLGNSENSESSKITTQASNIITNKTAFGGDRNPDNLVYVFDAQQCPANDLLGVALSDGTLRLVNCRGVCVSILQLPGCESHLTAFSWDKTGSRLASCVASGHLILWNIEFADKRNGRVRPSCQAVLDGGHSPGRPLFGASFCGDEEEVRFKHCTNINMLTH